MATTTDTSTIELNPASGVRVATRAVLGLSDTWHEDLYAIPSEGGVLLGVWGHEALGEIPGDWYDDDGNLKAMHQTADGGLRLPEVFGGHQVVDFLDGMFVGELEPVSDAVLVADAEDDSIRLALGALEWPLDALDRAKAAVDQLQDAPVLGATQQSDDAAPLTLSFFSMVVKRSAVVRSYPGGEEAFMRRYHSAQQNADLFLLVRMSMGDVYNHLDDLFDVGVIPGQDVAVGDMFRGARLDCAGVAFREVDGGFMSRWQVAFHEPHQE